MNITGKMNRAVVIPFLESCSRERHDAALKTLLAGDTLAQCIKQVALRDAIFKTDVVGEIKRLLSERTKIREVKKSLARVLKDSTQAGAVQDGGLPIDVSRADVRDIAALRQAGLIK